MGDLKTRLRTKLLRRSSTVAAASPTSTTSNISPRHEPSSSPANRHESPLARVHKSVFERSLGRHKDTEAPHSPTQQSKNTRPAVEIHKNEDHPTDLETLARTESLMSGDQRTLGSSIMSYPSAHDAPSGETSAPDTKTLKKNPIDEAAPPREPTEEAVPPLERKKRLVSEIKLPVRESASARKQSLIADTDVEVIKTLLHDDPTLASAVQNTIRPMSMNGAYTTTAAINPSMLHRKIWVKRPSGAATIVVVKEDDMVDEAKDAILHKLKNSLGKYFDAPDVTIRILSRDEPGERVLSPDETICRILDTYYPGGQAISEALIIDVPVKNKTPRPSPRAHPYVYYCPEETSRPHESGTDYFPPMPPVLASPAITTSLSHDSRHSHATHERAMSVLNTGQVPPLPSPGGTRRAHIARSSRPGYTRTHTSSPTALNSSVVSSRPARPRRDSTASGEISANAPQPPPLVPTPPAQEASKQVSNPPTPRVSSPRPSKRKTKQKQANKEPTPASLPGIGIIDTAVPPINVLIVEDNHINMKLLEQFIRRLKVRWQTAMNGREAVNKWRQGGFHLVLMDIQLPIMSGLEATKEIRRLERVNNIGAFSNTPSDAGSTTGGDMVDGEYVTKDEDKLDDTKRLFKSPVIIVALTASNLQSDRHEALAAGCNDFLTKPVNFVWFERKVKEWGCMQALIDFDGWRKWKDFADSNGLKDASSHPAGLAGLKKAASPTSQKKASIVPPVAAVSDGGAVKAVETAKSEDAGPDKDGSKTPTPPAAAALAFRSTEAPLVKDDSPDTVVEVGKAEGEAR